ncbi:MAG: ABC transporter ATP-binding protein [Opitutales bacterium]|nr:ABC transporter ATP-binding protein [Opitutales bacterium]
MNACSTPIGMSDEEVLGFHVKPKTELKSAKPILEVQHLTRSFETPNGTLKVLDDVNFSVMPGKSVAVIGPSGSGKTTLIALCAGLDLATSGDVIVDGVSLASLSENDRAQFRNRRIGFVFQNFQLIPHLTALENVMIPIELRGERSARNDAKNWLIRLGLESRMTSLPGELSGGELQRVALARAFIARPKVIFADEPTGNLDDGTSRAIVDELFQINRTTGTTLVIVTHDVNIAEKADRILHLKQGSLLSR